MALENNHFYIVEQKDKSRDIGKYDANSNSFLIGRFNVKLEDVSAYSSVGFLPEDILQMDTQMQDAESRIRDLEVVVSCLETNDIAAALLAMQEYLNKYVYFQPHDFIKRLNVTLVENVAQ